MMTARKFQWVLLHVINLSAKVLSVLLSIFH